MQEPRPFTGTLESDQFRQGVRGSGEVIFLTDRAGFFTFVNSQFEHLYGYAAAEVVGRATPRILRAGTAPPGHFEAFWQRLLKGEVVRTEFLNQAKDGTLLNIEATVSPVRDAADHIIGFFAVQRDVTERTRAEAVFRLSDKHVRLITDNMQDLVGQLTLDGTYLYVSPSHETVLGYAPASLLGTSAIALVHPEDLPHVRGATDQAIQCRTPVRFEVRYRHADGHYIWLEAVGSLLVDEHNVPSGAVVSGRDITDRKQLESQLRQAQKMEAVGQLAGGIAHDFNNVLTAILGYCELALGRLDASAELAGDLREIREAGERASRLTRQLLAFSRRQFANPQVVDLNQVIVEMEKMLGRLISKAVRLTIAPASTLGRTKIDTSHIEQLVLNLVVNSSDAMPKGGVLTISTANRDLDEGFVKLHPGARQGSYVALSVRDTGDGIQPDVLDRVFEPFFTTKPVGKGTGLGLSTVYGIVKQNGGYVTIDSTPGIGTVVTSYFPRVDDPLTLRATESPVAWMSGTETILVAEDEGPIRELVVKILGRLGYTILQACDGAEAMVVDAAHTGPIDLLISDVIMPQISGPDLGQRLVARRPDMKVLYISGFASRLPVGTGQVSAHTRFLAKPFTSDALALKVREILDLEPVRPRPSPAL